MLRSYPANIKTRTSIERDILSRLPTDTLEYLAITACDDSAVGDVGVAQDPDNPNMVQVTTMRKVSALDSLGWAGFNSSQL